MGTRMERHQKKKKKRSVKKLKFVMLLLLVLGLVVQLNLVNNKLRKSTDTSDHNLYEIGKKGDEYSLHLLGKNYYIKQDSIKNIFENVKETLTNTYEILLNYKEQILNK